MGRIVSLASALADLSPQARKKILGRLTDREALALLWDWNFWARPHQLPPPELDTAEKFIWLLMAGRGFGKTRSGAQWTHARAKRGDARRWIALIAYDPDEARDVMIEGPAGIMKIAAPWERPHYEPSKRRLTWPSGAYAKVFSSEDPEELRGYSGDTAWLDEPAKYKNLQDVWDNLLFGLREGKVSAPKVCLTTTPKPKKLIKELLVDPACVVTTGTSYENRDNLDPTWFKFVIEAKEGTTLGMQEIYAKLLDEMPGALWKRAWIDAHRLPRKPPANMTRIVVSVDPPGVSGEGGAECGITVGGSYPGEKGLKHMALLDDRSKRGTPAAWGEEAVKAYYEWDADRLVAEVNHGGEMVEHTIRTISTTLADGRKVSGKNVAFKAVRASRGKKTRAEPVSALYEQGRGHHCGTFPDLEDQLCTWEESEADDVASPDRLDSLVWLGTELILGSEQPTRVKLPVLTRGTS